MVCAAAPDLSEVRRSRGTLLILKADFLGLPVWVFPDALEAGRGYGRLRVLRPNMLDASGLAHPIQLFPGEKTKT